MYVNSDREGQLNNYATESNIYYAEYPNVEQQSRYAFQGAIAVLFTGLLLLIAIGVS
ncbi:MAG TPA: ssl1498 family light-harvesting-like protein [Oculatellaceae cyanobacterium]|jgi:hypothetical protein